MTRLCAEDIRDIASTLEDYDNQLVKKTGLTLKQIASRAVGVDEGEVGRVFGVLRVAVIPVTSGQGVISGFAQSVLSIVRFLGLDVFVTQNPDVAGLAEAFERGTKVLMLADDHRFVAINSSTGRVVDNSEATAKGYAVALDMMAGGLGNRDVLIIGAGRVGKGAAVAMAGLGARISIYDVDRVRSVKLAEELKCKFNARVNVEFDLSEALFKHRILFDACPAPDFISSCHITSETVVAAPGVPTGLSAGAMSKIAGRYLHDKLQIGVATMIFGCIAPEATPVSVIQGRQLKAGG